MQMQKSGTSQDQILVVQQSILLVQYQIETMRQQIMNQQQSPGFGNNNNNNNNMMNQNQGQFQIQQQHQQLSSRKYSGNEQSQVQVKVQHQILNQEPKIEETKLQNLDDFPPIDVGSSVKMPIQPEAHNLLDELSTKSPEKKEEPLLEALAVEPLHCDLLGALSCHSNRSKSRDAPLSRSYKSPLPNPTRLRIMTPSRKSLSQNELSPNPVPIITNAKSPDESP